MDSLPPKFILDKSMTRLRKVWKDWSAKDYLSQYYLTSEIPTDEREIFDFIYKKFKDLEQPFPLALEFGSGPTLHHAVSLVPFVEQLHLADYVPENLEESKRWLDNHQGAHNWDVYFEGILKLYGESTEQIEDRKSLLRKKITKLMHGDLNSAQPLKEEAHYPLVASFYCADSATSSKSEWKKFMSNLFNLVAPGGTIIMSALRNCKGYKVGDRFFPSANVNEVDFEESLVFGGFRPESLDIATPEVREWKDEGFDSIVLASAVKK